MVSEHRRIKTDNTKVTGYNSGGVHNNNIYHNITRQPKKAQEKSKIGFKAITIVSTQSLEFDHDLRIPDVLPYPRGHK